MFRRLVNKFVLWAPPATLGTYLVALGVAATAAPVNSDAKAFLDDQIAMLRAVGNAPYLVAWVIGLVVLWLGIYVWSLEREAERVPAPQKSSLIVLVIAKIRNVFHKELRVETKPVPSLKVEFIPAMPFREVVRRVALHTEWGLSYEPSHWPHWQDDLKREVLHKLAEVGPASRGIRNAPGEPEDSAPTPIASGFWAKADFSPEHMLVDSEASMVWQKGDPCPLLYVEVAISRPDVDRIWPMVSREQRNGRISAFAGLAREWYDQQEDARLNRNPGAAFDVAWNEGAKLDSLSRAAADRAAYEGRKVTGGISDPVALGARLLDDDAKAAEEARKALRRALIAKGRDMVARFRAEHPSEAFEPWVRRQREFLDVQPHLGDEYQKWVIRNAERNVSAIADGEFLRELRRLERDEWDLI